MKNMLFPAAAVLMCACAMPQPGMYGKSAYSGFGFGAKRPAVSGPAGQDYIDEVIEIVTEPPGARVLVNDATVGSAPLRYVARRLWRGEPPYMTLDTVKIEAFPVTAGHCVQSGIYGQNNLKVQSPVRFRMDDCRRPEYPQPAPADKAVSPDLPKK